jgi:3-oxoacyl-[acyl-carrier protein] reductase
MTIGPRVALVSGGSRGIGRACVLRLAADGHDIGFCYHSNADAARVLEKEVSELGVRVVSQRVDVSDGAAVRSWVAEVAEELGPIDVAVTSAGITRDNPLVLMTDDEWHGVVETNLNGVYNVCRAVVFDMMKRRTGSLVNISSVSGVHGNPTQSNYSASKAGIIGFTKALAKEVGRYGIRANVVAPGLIETDMTAGLAEPARRKMLQGVPLKRLGTAEEVADLTSFLASDRAGYITGSVVQIDGGLVV